MLDLSKSWDQLPSRNDLLAKRKLKDMDELPSPNLQACWDIPDKLCLRVAVSGRSAHGATGPVGGFALDIDSYTEQAVEAIEAGASCLHLDLGGIDTRGLSTMAAYEKIVALISSRTRRDFVRDVNILYGKTFQENMLPITSGLGEMTVMAPDYPVDWMEAVARVVTDRGKRLFFSIHSAAEVDLAERQLIRKGILEKPYCWALLIGYVYDDTTIRKATFMPNPKAMIQELNLIVDRIHEIDRNSYINVTGGGRAAQYLNTLAILMGLHVRVGTEDTVWRYPHKDEYLSGAAENVKRTRIIAEQLGRPLATAEEFRNFIRIKKT